MPQPLTHQYLWKTELVKNGLITYNELEYTVAVSIIGCTLPDHFDMTGTIKGLPQHNNKEFKPIILKTLNRYIKKEKDYGLVFDSMRHHLYVDTICHALFENKSEWDFLLNLKKDLLKKPELKALFPKDQFLLENRMESFIHPLLEFILDMYILQNKKITGHYIEYAKKIFFKTGETEEDRILIDKLTMFYADIKAQYKNLSLISKDEVEELRHGISEDLKFLKKSVNFETFGTPGIYDLIELYKVRSQLNSRKPTGDAVEFYNLLQPSLREALKLSNFVHPSRFFPRKIKREKKALLELLVGHGFDVLSTNGNFSETFKKLFEDYPKGLEV